MSPGIGNVFAEVFEPGGAPFVAAFFCNLSGVPEGGPCAPFGFFARLAGAAIFGDMMIAIVTVTWADGINATGGQAGYELNLALGVLALMIAFFGAGRFSVDALLERRLLRS